MPPEFGRGGDNPLGVAWVSWKRRRVVWDLAAAGCCLVKAATTTRTGLVLVEVATGIRLRFFHWPGKAADDAF